MNVKIRKYIFVFFIFISFFSLFASAQDNEIYSKLEMDKIENAIPNDIKNHLPSDFFDIEGVPHSQKISLSGIFSFLADIFPDTLKSAISNFAKIFSLIVVASVFSMLKASFSSNALKDVFSLACVLAISSATIGIVSSVFQSAEAFMNSLCVFISALAPSMAVISAYSGNAASAAVNAANVTLILAIMSGAFTKIVFPAMRICFCLSLAASVFDTLKISGIAAFIKKTLISFFLFAMSLLGAVMGYQSIIAKSADGATLRTVKFAAGSFIPIIGSSLSEAMSSILSVVGQMKNILGGLASIVIIMMLLPTVINLLLNRLFISFSGECANMLSLEKEGALIKEISSYISIALALCIASCVLFLFAIGLFLGGGFGSL